MSLTRGRAEALLARFPDCTLVVAGDLMLDRYVYGSVERISPEAPVPVVRVQREKMIPGGAGNVACNVRALGARAVVCGWAGRDAEGRTLRALLRRAGVGVDGVCAAQGGRTVVKTRIIADRQQVVRVDWDAAPTPTADEASAFLEGLDAALSGAAGLILEDYGRGTLTPQVVRGALRAASRRRLPVGLDPKRADLPVAGIGVVTPNRHEAFAAAGIADPGPASSPLRDRALRKVGQRLLEVWRPRHLLITLGPQGMLLMAPGEDPVHVPTRAREVFDVSGAGDTVIAANVLALAAGASAREAAELANWAAGVVVGKIGTATCSVDELLAAVPP